MVEPHGIHRLQEILIRDVNVENNPLWLVKENIEARSHVASHDRQRRESVCVTSTPLRQETPKYPYVKPDPVYRRLRGAGPSVPADVLRREGW